MRTNDYKQASICIDLICDNLRLNEKLEGISCSLYEMRVKRQLRLEEKWESDSQANLIQDAMNQNGC